MIWIVFLLACACFFAAVFPFVPMAHGFVRAFDFPRIQLALLSAGVLILSVVFLAFETLGRVTIALSATALVIQLSYIVRFTRLWWRRSKAFEGNANDLPIIRLLVSNVKMGNRRYGLLQDLIRRQSPDIGLFMEVDSDWVAAIDEVTTDYPHKLSCPQDTSYGLHLVSRFAFQSAEIKFLLNDDVPSFDIDMLHDDGTTFRLIAIHPEPPVLDEDTVGRDAEIAVVGEEVRDYEKPLIVTGDLNDVAWSRTTRRFLRISHLLDPREGRGLFNTFDARYLFLRWPLDHIFHSPHFQLVAMERMPFVGSDHFPMFYGLALTEQQTGYRQTGQASKEDLNEADDVIKKEKRRDDDPVGTDWEN
ncbi:MAG: hypothetical protein HKP56_05905 [Anderseniella sp.]|nr:hypothetical protein [Anderseniella sp.]